MRVIVAQEAMRYGRRLDLDAYFARIGYAGPRERDAGVLSALHAAHPARRCRSRTSTPLMGARCELDLDALQAKFVGQRRGGYCFEQNTLFKAVLRGAGVPGHGPRRSGALDGAARRAGWARAATCCSRSICTMDPGWPTSALAATSWPSRSGLWRGLEQTVPGRDACGWTMPGLAT